VTIGQRPRRPDGVLGRLRAGADVECLGVGPLTWSLETTAVISSGVTETETTIPPGMVIWDLAMDNFNYTSTLRE
jgi:hypothetical protein